MEALWSHPGVTSEHFGVTLEHFGATWGSFWDTSGSLWCYFWVYEGCFGATLFYFQKMLIFPMVFNDFIYLLAQLDATWGTFWGDFGALWRYFGGTLG